MAPPYLVSDAETGLAVMVDAPRARSAVNAVVASRFTACELDSKEVRALTIKGTKLIDAATGETDDGEEENVPAGQQPIEPQVTAVEQPESPGEGAEGLTPGETASDIPRFLKKDEGVAQASDAGAASQGEGEPDPAAASPASASGLAKPLFERMIEKSHQEAPAHDDEVQANG